MADPLNGRIRCGTMEVHERLLATDPAYADNQQRLEDFTRYYQEVNRSSGLRSEKAIIPVVVHIVYNTAAQNISDSQAIDQIRILNEDFRALNPDVSTVPSAFQTLVADARIQFQLAVRDPSCQPTTGITRTQTTVTQFTNDDAVKSAATGGADAWPRDEYLNLWVCPLGPLGYAQFPGGAAATDGVVVAYDAFGSIGTAAAPFDQGRTATHEIGHWFNLRHIWGDDSDEADTCSGSDFVDDTPNQSVEHYGCPEFPQPSCDNGESGDMFMNYMDYTDDACMFMFSAGQSLRMDAALYGARSAILASGALVPFPAPPDADLWSQNSPQDVGIEPDTNSEKVWVSNDIWVRRQQDGTNNQEHQDPEYRLPSEDPNYVYVRVRNRSCSNPGGGTLRVYWAKASTNTGWPAPFDGSVTAPALMGDAVGSQAIASVPGAAAEIVELPWYPPNPADYASFGADRAHFCLLSRIETSPTSPFGMTFPEGSHLGTNIRNNNNIVLKNVTIVGGATEGGRAWVTVGNLGGKSLVRLLFTSSEGSFLGTVLDWGTVQVDLGDDLFQRWETAGSVGEGIEKIQGNWIQVMEPVAWISEIVMDPGEYFTIGVMFQRTEDQPRRYAVFDFDVSQYNRENGEEVFVGAQTFTLKTVP